VTWGRLDDGFYAHPKVRRALDQDPMAVALFALAISWSAGHEQDGAIPDEAMQMLAPKATARRKALKVLEDGGLIHRNGSGWLLHDYLDYNYSREELEERRQRDRRRKAAGSARTPA
jgi:hypothetical protein